MGIIEDIHAERHKYIRDKGIKPGSIVMTYEAYDDFRRSVDLPYVHDGKIFGMKILLNKTLREDHDPDGKGFYIY